MILTKNWLKKGIIQFSGFLFQLPNSNFNKTQKNHSYPQNREHQQAMCHFFVFFPMSVFRSIMHTPRKYMKELRGAPVRVLSLWLWLNQNRAHKMLRFLPQLSAALHRDVSSPKSNGGKRHSGRCTAPLATAQTVTFSFVLFFFFSFCIQSQTSFKIGLKSGCLSTMQDGFCSTSNMIWSFRTFLEFFT